MKMPLGLGWRYIIVARMFAPDGRRISVAALSERTHFSPTSHAHVLNRHLPNSSVGYETPADAACGLLTAERGRAVLHHRGDSLDGVRAADVEPGLAQQADAF